MLQRSSRGFRMWWSQWVSSTVTSSNDMTWQWGLTDPQGPHACLVPKDDRRAIRSPGTRVTILERSPKEQKKMRKGAKVISSLGPLQLI
ncbi:rCG48105, partial [Rattus norvegicus]